MFRLGQFEDVNDLVEKCHYTHRKLLKVFVLLTVSVHADGGYGFWGHGRKAKAGCFFCTPPTRWSEPVIELLRMVRVESYEGPPLSQLVSFGLMWLRKKKLGDLVVSFADPSFGHHGGIYQACSWNYGGVKAGGIDGYQIGRRFVPRRTCYHLYGTSSYSKLVDIFRYKFVEVVPHYDPGKHFYWKALTEPGTQKAARLGLEYLAYPKPEVCQTKG